MLKTEAYYGSNIIHQVMTSNDFSDTTKWELFEPDLDLPEPYVENGLLVVPKQDWSQEKADSYFEEKRQRLLEKWRERKSYNDLRNRCFNLNEMSSRTKLPLYLR